MAEEEQESPEQWDGIVRRQASLTVRSVDEARRAVRFLASNETVDSHGDIVEQDWDLERYKKNPIVLWNHERWGDDIVIGRAEDTKVTNDGLEVTVVFAPASLSERAEKVYGMVREDFIRAVSVGFRPRKVRLEEREDGHDVYRLSGNELYEISVVPIPSNPDSVARSADAERAFLQRMAGVSPAERLPKSDNKAGRAAAAHNKESNHMDKDHEKAVEAARVEAAAAQKVADDLRNELKAAKAEGDALTKSLEAEKTARAEAEKRAEEAEAVSVEKEIDELVGKKFYPAERDEQLELAKSIGIDRVKAIAEKRPDITLTDPVQLDGKTLGESKSAPAPVSGEGSVADEINATAREAAKAS